MRRWIKRTIIAVVVYLLVVTVIGVINRFTTVTAGVRELTLITTQLDSVEPAWRWEDLEILRRKALPKEHNIGALVMKFVEIDQNTPRREPNPQLLLYDTLKDLPRFPNERLPEESTKVLRWGLNQLTPKLDVVARIRKAGANYYFVQLAPDWISTQIEHVQRYRELFALLHYQTCLAIEDGEFDLAADTLREQMRVIELFGEEPWLISQLVRLAGGALAKNDLERLLGHAVIADASLEKFQTMFEAESKFPFFTVGIRGERAGFHHLMTNLANGSVPPGNVLSGQASNWLEQFGEWKFRATLPKNHAFMLRHYTQCIEADRLPPWERLEAVRKLEVPPDDKEWTLSRLFLPASEKVLTASLRQMTMLRCTAVAIACERFRLKNGRWPTNYQQLVPDLLSEMPIDPLTGSSLLLHPEEDGITIYSVGQDGQDDHGILWRGEPNNPIGYDFGVRLWNPENRRRPAPETPPEVLSVFPHEPEADDEEGDR